MEPFSLLSLLAFVSVVLAIGQKSTINFHGDGCALATGGSSVQIFAEDHDWPAVLRVTDDLALDFGRVTGVNGSVTLLNDGAKSGFNASMIYNVTGKTSFVLGGKGKKGGVIIVGTIGRSRIIDQLASEGRIDTGAIKGKWEAYVSMLIYNPMPGVSEALVIAGNSIAS